MMKEFKEFALKGNVIDLAVAVIIGTAFGTIISSMVVDVITPLLLTPALEAAHLNDLKQLSWGAVKYGNFLAAIINFIIIAFVLFLIIKGINQLNRKKDARAVAPPVPQLSLTEKLLTEIRDGIKSGNQSTNPNTNV